MAKRRTQKWHWFKFDWVSYEEDTEHLTYAQHGAYFLLLKNYYKTGGALKPSHMAGIVKATKAEWDEVLWPALAEFFTLGEDGLYHNKRADLEIDDREDVSDERSIAGQKSGESRRAKKAMKEAAMAGGSPALADGEQAPTNAEQLFVQVQGQVESTPPSEGGAPPMVQASLLDEPDVPPTIEKMLWSEGLAIYARLSKRPPSSCRSQLGDLAKIAGPEVLLEVLRNHRDKPAKDSAYAWVKSCCEVRKNQAPRLVVDNDPNDAWGIDAWCRSLPGVVPTSSDTERAIGKWVIHGRVIDAFAKSIAKAAMLPGSWRGDWSALEGWARDKIKTNDAIAAVRSRVEWGDYDPNRVASIKMFDTSVRGGRKAA